MNHQSDTGAFDTSAFEKAAMEAAAETRYVLRLYVGGMALRSVEAFANLKALCEKHLAGRYEVEVIDIYANPSLAKGEQIVAVPTLVIVSPPGRRLIGNLADSSKVLAALRLAGAVGSVTQHPHFLARARFVQRGVGTEHKFSLEGVAQALAAPRLQRWWTYTDLFSFPFSHTAYKNRN
jgi:circadian clock protein KaiB